MYKNNKIIVIFVVLLLLSISTILYLIFSNNKENSTINNELSQTKKDLEYTEYNLKRFILSTKKSNNEILISSEEYCESINPYPDIQTILKFSEDEKNNFYNSEPVKEYHKCRDASYINYLIQYLEKDSDNYTLEQSNSSVFNLDDEQIIMKKIINDSKSKNNE